MICGSIEKDPTPGWSPAGPCVLAAGHLNSDHAGFHADARGNWWRDCRYVYAPGETEPYGIEVNGFADTVESP